MGNPNWLGRHTPLLGRQRLHHATTWRRWRRWGVRRTRQRRDDARALLQGQRLGVDVACDLQHQAGVAGFQALRLECVDDLRVRPAALAQLSRSNSKVQGCKVKRNVSLSEIGM